MNNFSILVLILSYFILILSVISEFGSGSGWTLYPPLSTSFMNLSVSSTAYLIFGLLFSGISSCATSVNFWITILNLRSYSLILKTLPLFPEAILLAAGINTTSIIRRIFNDFIRFTFKYCIFRSSIWWGSSFISTLVLVFGHPEVYVLIIPAFGLISIIISGIA